MHFLGKISKSFRNSISFTENFLQQRCLSEWATFSDHVQKIQEEHDFDMSLRRKVNNELFDATRKKQLAKLVPRLEKIEVRYQGRGMSESAVMFMNKHLSTPFHCAMHISKTVANSAVLAVITPTDSTSLSSSLLTPLQGNEVVSQEESEPQSILWDIHRPLPCNCKLEILKFNMENSSEWHHRQVNRAYWNSCSLILGAVMQEAFKENFQVGLYHLPHISENRGAFCYDVALDDKLKDWHPSEKDLIYFTKLARSIISQNLKFERLEVTPQIAFEIFENDRYQCGRVQAIVDRNGPDSPITLYRCGQYIDVSSGPHISNTSLIYHYVVVAFHRLNCSDAEDVRRIQGLSLPKDLRVHHALWSMLENRARKLVKQDLKHTTTSTTDSEVDNETYESIENKTKEYMISTGQWREGQWKDTSESFELKTDK